MKSPLTLALAFAVVLASAASAAASAPEPKRQATEQEIKARLAEHALKKNAPAPAADAAKKDPKSATAAPVAKDAAAKDAVTKDAPEKSPAPTKDTAAQILPNYEVRVAPITELDRQLDKQNREIAAEKRKAKPTPLDEALNGKKTSRALALFGGESGDYRAGIAAERARMMEDEKDLIEAIAAARTAEEKKELQETLDAMRTLRRDLERSVR